MKTTGDLNSDKTSCFCNMALKAITMRESNECQEKLWLGGKFEVLQQNIDLF